MLRFGRSPANGIGDELSGIPSELAVHDYTIVFGYKEEEKKEEGFFYDINQPTILQVHASQCGLGACLLQDDTQVYMLLDLLPLPSSTMPK